MLKTKKIVLFLVLVTLSGCAAERMADKHLPTVSQSVNFPYGGWVSAELKQTNDARPGLIEGEMIAFQDHRLYILGTEKMQIIPDTSVHRATLYMYKKQPWIFAILTAVGILPNLIAAIAYPEYAAQFLVLGILPLVSGTVFTVTEATSGRNQMIFPDKNSIEDFVKFSRFPQGIPAGVDIEQLKLPEVK
jgi:hypothetical protein